MGEGVAPLPFVAEQRTPTSFRAAGTCRGCLLTLRAAGNHMLVHVPQAHRMRQSSRYPNRK